MPSGSDGIDAQSYFSSDDANWEGKNDSSADEIGEVRQKIASQALIKAQAVSPGIALNLQRSGAENKKRTQ